MSALRSQIFFGGDGAVKNALIKMIKWMQFKKVSQFLKKQRDWKPGRGVPLPPRYAKHPRLPPAATARHRGWNVAPKARGDGCFRSHRRHGSA